MIKHMVKQFRKIRIEFQKIQLCFSKFNKQFLKFQLQSNFTQKKVLF